MHTDSSWQMGLDMLQKPVWPLCNMVCLLYLTTDYESLDELFMQLPSELETQAGIYRVPLVVLDPYRPFLKAMEYLKRGEVPPGLPRVISPEGGPVDTFDQVNTWIKQKVLEKELEQINSMLCAPMHCTLCCTGPAPEHEKEYFEIPLRDNEVGLFTTQSIDTEESRAKNPEDETPFLVKGTPFYRAPSAVYHWRKGWSLILPKGSSCPNLGEDGRCHIYLERPYVCRKPQIFPMVLEAQDPLYPDKGELILHDVLLAVTDCPYVEELREQILDYAALYGLKVVFKANKK